MSAATRFLRSSCAAELMQRQGVPRHTRLPWQVQAKCTKALHHPLFQGALLLPDLRTLLRQGRMGPAFLVCTREA